MLDIIALYDGIIKPDELAAIVEANTIFEQSGYSNHELQLVEITAIRDLENDDKAALIFSVFYEHLDTCLMEFGIRVKRDDTTTVPLSIMVELLSAMLSLDDPDNRTIVSEALDRESSDTIYTLADLLSEFVPYPTMEIYTWLETVDDSIITAIHKMAGDPDLHEDLTALHNDIRDRYLKFVGEKRIGIVYETAQRLITLPASLNTIMEEITPTLEQYSDPDTIAFEIYSLVLLSGHKDDIVLDKAIEMRQLYLPEVWANIDLSLKQHHEAFYGQA